jgi:hypothetical protein
MDHCLPQVLRLGFAAVASECQSMGLAVVCDHAWVIDRQVFGALLKVTHRVSTFPHDVRHEFVGFCDRSHGHIHETRLHSAPGFGVSGALFIGEGVNVELSYPLLTSKQFILRTPLIAGLFNDVIVLGAESISELVCVAPTHE